MALKPIFYLLGNLLSLFALAMLVPALWEVFFGQGQWFEFILSAALTGFLGAGLLLANKSSRQINLSVREAFLVTALSWLVLASVSAMPFKFSLLMLSNTDAFFESVSALTTTGSTILPHLNRVPSGILLWRALLQWLGGIGIVVMALIILPVLKIGGMQLFRAESSDRSEKILPRISQISSIIFSTYIILTIVFVVFLWIAGMTFFEALCHSLSAISTGGLSTADSSIAYFGNPFIEIILMVAMLIGGSTLILVVRALRSNEWGDLFSDRQFRTYIKIIFFTTMILTLWRFLVDQIDFWEALRHCLFTVISLVTTTGFVSQDYMIWGAFPIVLLFIVSFIGGCTGSTSGGLKIFRIQVLFSIAKSQIQQLRRPNGIFIPTYNQKPIAENVVLSVLTFFVLFGFSVIFISLLLGMCGFDLLSAISGAAACITNVGPGFSKTLGPSSSFATLSDNAKMVMTFAMILGRLEIMTIFILLMPSFWKS